MSDTARTRLRATGKALSIVLPVVGIAGLSAILALPASNATVVSDERSLDEVAPRSLIVGAELEHLQLRPDVLAAAGVTSEQTRTIVSVLGVDSDFGIDRSKAARETHRDAVEEYERLRARIRSGRGGMLDPDKCAELKERAEAALNACVAARDASYDAVGALLGRGVSERLDRISRGVRSGTPLPYAAIELTDAQRVALLNAIAARRQAERDGVALHPRHAALLAQLDANPEVRSAADAMGSIEFIEDAYRSALYALDR